MRQWRFDGRAIIRTAGTRPGAKGHATIGAPVPATRLRHCAGLKLLRHGLPFAPKIGLSYLRTWVEILVYGFCPRSLVFPAR